MGITTASRATTCVKRLATAIKCTESYATGGKLQGRWALVRHGIDYSDPVADGQMSTSPIHERERDFHDALARELEPEQMPPRAPDELESALLDRLGDVDGRRVLDLGCGTGELTLQLLARGARVTALDLSPGMVEVARRRAAAFAPHGAFEGVAMPAESTGLPDSSFDLVIGKYVLHHVELEAALEEFMRLLAPDGRAIFIENSGLNPLLMLARRRLAGRFGIPRFGTPDERPLGKLEYRLLKSRFPSARLEFPEFTFFQLLDRQLLRFRRPRVTRLLRALDDAVHRLLPPLRRYGFRVFVVIGR